MWKNTLKTVERLGRKRDKKIIPLFSQHLKVFVHRVLNSTSEKSLIYQDVFSYPLINTPNSSNNFYI